VDGVSFSVSVGETYGLLGPNGAGKTTTISMIAGLLEPTEGSVIVRGEHMSPKSFQAKRSIGLVPQELAIYPDLTGRENLRFFGGLYDLRGNDLSERVQKVLSTVGLSNRADDRASEYSGGMKRRLNIAVGLLHEPDLLILDEPTVGVDPQARNAILESVEHLAHEGMSVLYTTHYMEEAERLCDRVGIIDQGVLVAEGTRRELVATVGQSDTVTLVGTGDLAAGAEAVRRVDGVRDVAVVDGSMTMLVHGAASILPALMSRVADAGVSITGVDIEEPNLEAVFLHLTGKALRD